jgi:signal transduction histidine kinase
MRWPIQIQLLLPFLSVVLLAILLACVTIAYLGTTRARHQQEENLRRVVGTLTEATFPPTERVLQQMSGLSGAEFVVLDEKNRIQGSTLRLPTEEGASLARLPREDRLENLSARAAVALSGRTYLGGRVPVARRGSARRDWLVVLYPEDQWGRVAREAAYPALFSGAIAAVAVMALTTVLARRFVRPIQQLGNQTAAIANGQFRPVDVGRRDDEIRDLAVSINRMTGKLGRYEDEVRQSERLRTLGQLGAGMAHQLRNAATGARMAIELHQRECPAGQSDESLGVAMRQLRLMESYLQRFLALGRSRPLPHQRLRLAGLLEDVVELVRPACAHARIELQWQKSTDPLEVLGDREALQQLLVNLLLNAIEAVGRQGEGPPQVTLELVRKPCDRVLLRVGDSGPGPAAQTRDRLFEPFVTDKPDGTGLGLYVARQVAEAHQGTIGWRRDNELTWFEVELPLATEEVLGLGCDEKGQNPNPQSKI